MPGMSLERVLWNLKLHRPDEETGERMDEVRDMAQHFATAIYELCPDSRERSLAITHLEDACQCAIAALARNTPDAPD